MYTLLDAEIPPRGQSKDDQEENEVDENGKSNPALQDVVGAKSQTSSFIMEQNSKNVIIATEDDGEDRSVTMTTFHNGTGRVDGAFKEENDNASLSHSVNLNNLAKDDQILLREKR